MKTAAVTMVYKDHWYLEKWVQYYGQLFGAENLHIISHGDDPVHCALAKDCNHIRVPHNQLPEDFDEQRWRMLSDPCAVLIKSYDWVICGDVDEIILPTRTDETLPEALESDLEELKKTLSDERSYRQNALISWGHVQRRKSKRGGARRPGRWDCAPEARRTTGSTAFGQNHESLERR